MLTKRDIKNIHQPIQYQTHARIKKHKITYVVSHREILVQKSAYSPTTYFQNKEEDAPNLIRKPILANGRKLVNKDSLKPIPTEAPAEFNVKESKCLKFPASSTN